MRLIGMMDSPFVRRVAVTMRLFGAPHSHDQISVFRQADDFANINPLMKAPTLILDDGQLLMDSSLILDWLEVKGDPVTFLPNDPGLRGEALSLIGYALMGTEKAMQWDLERKRPQEKRHDPWADRCAGQARAAFAHLERECAKTERWLVGHAYTQADITLACCWGYVRRYCADLIAENAHPAIAAHAARCEARPEFQATTF
jgi:glutathione S-transferase